MTTPDHHLPEAWLISSATGNLTEAQAVIVATHVTLCPRCRADLELAEEVAAGSLRRAPEADIDPGGLQALMARLDEPETEQQALPTDSILPWPVLQHTGPLDQIEWSWLAYPWIRGLYLPHATTGLPLTLIHLKADTYLPHRHTGSEAGVILSGGWTDQTGHYQRGDAFYTEPKGEIHEQRIDPGPPCIALVLNDERGEVDGLRGFFARAFFKV